MTVLLYRPEVGKVVNLRDGVYRVEQVGQDMSCFPGGRGVFMATVRRVCDGPLTVRELEDVAQRLSA